jgi:hypothetical protein
LVPDDSRRDAVHCLRHKLYRLSVVKDPAKGVSADEVAKIKVRQILDRVAAGKGHADVDQNKAAAGGVDELVFNVIDIIVFLRYD